MARRKRAPDGDGTDQKRPRRSRSRHAGSIAGYATRQGHRWKFQIYALKDPERPELGETRITRGGFKTLDEAQAALAGALKKKARNEKFQGAVPTIGAYAAEWTKGLRLEASTVQGYEKVIRNHITPALGDIHLDKLTATRIASHYRELERSGRRDQRGYGKPCPRPSTLSPVRRFAPSAPRSRPGPVRSSTRT